MCHQVHLIPHSRIKVYNLKFPVGQNISLVGYSSKDYATAVLTIAPLAQLFAHSEGTSL